MMCERFLAVCDNAAYSPTVLLKNKEGAMSPRYTKE
jgi:hypothetical protein